MHSMKNLLRFASLMLLSVPALGQETPAPAVDELDVTMQIILDPAAKVPDSVVRRIKLPLPAGAAGQRLPPAQQGPDGQAEKPQLPSQAGGEFGKEVSERAREMARE